MLTAVHWRSQRGRGALAPSEWEKNIKASLVNLTLNMRYKNDTNIIFVITTFVFFKLKMHQHPFSAGALPGPAGGAYDAPPDPLAGWGGGYPLHIGRGIPLPSPHSPHRSTPLASRTRRLRRLGSQAPSTQNPGYASAAVAKMTRKRL